MDLSLAYSRDLDAYDVSMSALTADLEGTDTLVSAVVLSLLTDRTAAPSDVPAGGVRRGWWADAYAPEPGDQFGSRLWLLAREKQTPATLARAQAYCEEALAWLVTDGLASRVVVTTFAPRMGWIVADVQITLPASSRRYRFEWSDAGQIWRLAGEVQ